MIAKLERTQRTDQPQTPIHIRPLVKSAYQNINFLISQPNHM